MVARKEKKHESERPMKRFDPYSPEKESRVRLDIQGAIARDLKNGRPVIIRGLYQSGKTSLLFSLMNNELKGENYIHIDSSTCLDKDSVNFVYPVVTLLVNRDFGFDTTKNELLSILENRAREAGKDPETAYDEYEATERELFNLHLEEIQAWKTKTGRSELEYLNEFLAAEGETAYLLFDETTRYFQKESTEAINMLESAKSLSNIRSAYVIHYAPSLSQEIDTFSKGVEEYWMRPLKPFETRTVVEEAAEGRNISISKKAADRIHALTGGRPFEQRELISRIFMLHENLRMIGIRHVEEAATWVMQEDMQRFNLIGGQNLRALSDEDRALLSLIVKLGPISKKGVLEEDVAPLIKAGVLAEDRDARTYRINGILFENMVRSWIAMEERSKK